MSPNSVRSGRAGRFGSMFTMNAILRDMSSLSLDQQDLAEFSWEPDHSELEEDDEHGPLWMGEDTTPRHSSRSPAAHASRAQPEESAAGGLLAGRQGFWTDRLPPEFLHTSPEATLSRTQSGEVTAGSRLAGRQLTNPSSTRPFGVDLNSPPGRQPMPPGRPAIFAEPQLSRTQSEPWTVSNQLAIPPNQFLRRMSQSPAQQQASRSPDRRASPASSHGSAGSRDVAAGDQLAGSQNRMRLSRDEITRQRQASRSLDAPESRARSAQGTAASQLVQLSIQEGSQVSGRRRHRSRARDSQEPQAQRQRYQRDDSDCSLESANSAFRGSSVDSIGDLDVESRVSSPSSGKNQGLASGEACASSRIQGGSGASAKTSQDSSNRGDKSQRGGCAPGGREQDSREQRRRHDRDTAHGQADRDSYAHRSAGSRGDRDTSLNRRTRHDRDRRRDRAESPGQGGSVIQAGDVEYSRERSRDQDLRSVTRTAARLRPSRQGEEQRGSVYEEEHTDSTSRERQPGSSGGKADSSE